MSIKSLSKTELEIVRRTMLATLCFFDVDFHTRMGILPDEMRALLNAWPNVDDSQDNSAACLAVNNSLNDLLYGEGISEQDAIEQIGVSRNEMKRVYRKWAAARGWITTGIS